MKMLTISRMAAARLRANKKQYLLLVVGIFLSVLLVTALCLSVYGVILALEHETDLRLGSQDAFLLDCPQITDEELETMGYFDRIGHVYVTAKAENTSVYLGYYDDTASTFLNRQLQSGRLPQAPGEIAMEESAMLEVWEGELPQVGDTVELTLEPVDGLPEKCSFTLVGILTDQTANLRSRNNITVDFVASFPAILISPEQPALSTGRLAVHRLMSMVVPSSEELFQTFWDRTTGSYDQHFWVVTLLGEVVECHLPAYYNLFDARIVALFMVGLLLLALLLACGVGIAGSMEGILQQRQEEIGILRALGATKRQIKGIFGRDSWLLALTTAPAAIAAACVFVWIVSLLAPKTLIFCPDPRLLLPVLVFSGAVILLSSQAPLHRAAGQMPMGVLRDTRLLRRAKGLSSSRSFRVPSLIARRMLRFYPSRMIGAAVLAFLMCFCAAQAAGTAYYRKSAISAEDPAYYIFTMESGITTGFASYLAGPGLSDQSIAQISDLPQVSRVQVSRDLPVVVLLEEKPDYLVGRLRSSNPQLCSFEDYAREQQLIANKYQSDAPDDQALREDYDLAQKEYAQIRNALGITQEMAQLDLLTVELTQELESCLESGHIDIDAINAGQEVLVFAPKLWYVNGYGTFYGMTDDPVKYASLDPQSAPDNDCFYPGQTLSLMQIYAYDNQLFYSGEPMDYTKCQFYNHQVTVGGVLNALPQGVDWIPGGILTTEQGLKNMPLAHFGWDKFKVYLNSIPQGQQQEALTARVQAISRRSAGLYFIDRLAIYAEDSQQQTQTLLALVSISLVFFAVASGMIVSTLTRQLQSDGRRIGMLRAVGAQERTIFRCYIGQVYLPPLFGAALTGLALALLSGNPYFRIAPGAYALAAGCVLAFTAGCIVLCLVLLRQRLGQITRQSIIENIREL